MLFPSVKDGSRLLRMIGLALLIILTQTSCLSVAPQPTPIGGGHRHPILFLHGINQDASTMGVPQQDASLNAFVPLLAKLRAVYDPTFIQIFKYQDDRAFQGICPSANPPECLSQSSVTANALALAEQLSTLYSQAGNRKVALIGYSMGAAIIRSLLAGCPVFPPLVQPLERRCPDATQKIDDVFFINGVQQGSWLLAGKLGWDTHAGPNELTLSSAIYAMTGINTTYPAAQDLTPLSDNIQAHNRIALPGNIHYFNFFGNIQVHPVGNILGWEVPASHGIAAGDLVLLPGEDDPRAMPDFGGARFCATCGDQNTFAFKQIDSNSYAEWPLNNFIDWHYPEMLCTYLPTLGSPFMTSGEGRGILGNVAGAPQWHLAIYSDASLNDPHTISVQDSTGKGGKTSITNEILWQLEKGDGIQL